MNVVALVVGDHLDFRSWSCLRSTSRLFFDSMKRRPDAESLTIWGLHDGYLNGKNSHMYETRRMFASSAHQYWLRLNTGFLRVPQMLSVSAPRYDNHLEETWHDFSTPIEIGPYLGMQNALDVVGGGDTIIVSTAEFTVVHNIDGQLNRIASRKSLTHLAYWPGSPFFYAYDTFTQCIQRFSAEVWANSKTCSEARRWKFPTTVCQCALNATGLVTLRCTDHVSVWVTIGGTSTEIARIRTFSSCFVTSVLTLDSGYVAIVHSNGLLSVVNPALDGLHIDCFRYTGVFLFAFADTLVTSHMVINVKTKCSYYSRHLSNFRKGIMMNKKIALLDWRGVCRYYV